MTARARPAITTSARAQLRTLRALIRLDDAWHRRVRVLLDQLEQQQRELELAQGRAARAEAALARARGR